MEQFVAFGIFGLRTAAIYAIIGSGLVLTYATTGVFNFAHGAVGMIAAYLYYALAIQNGLPVPLAVIIVLFVFGPLMGLLTERVMRSFQDAPEQTTIVVTIALTVLLIGLAQKIWP